MEASQGRPAQRLETRVMSGWDGGIQARIAELLRRDPYSEYLSCCHNAEDHAAHVLVRDLVLTPVPISYPADRSNCRWWATASQWRGENGEWEWRT